MQVRFRCAIVLLLTLFCMALSGCGLLPSFSPELHTDTNTKRVQAPAHQLATQTPVASATVAISNEWVGGHLIIPAIQLDAPLEPVGVLRNGDLAVPSHDQWVNVGWYEYGPFPGSPGNAVIDGHLDRPGGVPAVFWRLHELQAGDTVIVADGKGKQWRFRVIQTTAYPPDKAPLKNIFGPANGVFLNLITCAGQWVAAQHQTSLRLVIYTQLVA